MYPRSPPTAGKNLEFCQPGEDLPTDLNQLVQPLPQVLHVGGVDFAALVGTFCHLIQIVAAILKQVRHPAQLRRMAYLLQMCSNNLNQYAKAANENGRVYAADMEDLRQRLDELIEIGRQILSRLAEL